MHKYKKTFVLAAAFIYDCNIIFVKMFYFVSHSVGYFKWLTVLSRYEKSKVILFYDFACKDLCGQRG